MAALYTRRTRGKRSYVITLQKRLEATLGAEAAMWAGARVWWRTRAWQDGNQAGGARGHVLAEQRLAADCLQPPLRSCLAAAIGRGSPPAFGFKRPVVLE